MAEYSQYNNENRVIIKCEEFSVWLAVDPLLTSQEGLCSVLLIGYVVNSVRLPYVIFDLY